MVDQAKAFIAQIEFLVQKLQQAQVQEPEQTQTQSEQELHRDELISIDNTEGGQPFLTVDNRPIHSWTPDQINQKTMQVNSIASQDDPYLKLKINSKDNSSIRSSIDFQKPR